MQANEKPLILVVDDVTKNLQVIGSVLSDNGYDISLADSGAIALDLLSSITPDLILLDVMMPELDGFQLCKILKNDEKYSAIPIIFLTAKQDNESVVHGFKLGAVDYITKPFNLDELLIRVKTHVDLQVSKMKILQYAKQTEELIKQKEEFFGIAVHDLKNPLNAIMGFSMFAMNEIRDSENLEIEKENLILYLLKVSEASKFMLKTINELLNIEILEGGTVKLNIVTSNLALIVESVIQTLLPTAESKNINIFVNKINGDLKARFDETRIREILENLLSNSIKFSNYNTNIYIKIYKSIINDQDFFNIAIKDEGPGFTSEDKKKMFGKFSKLSARPTANEGSTGLGLSIVKKLTELHKGSIKLNSLAGEGAEFIISIPLDKEFVQNFDQENELVFYKKNTQNYLNTISDFKKLLEEIKLIAKQDKETIDGDAREKLLNHYLPKSIELTKVNIINDILKFTQDVRDFGTKNNITFLIKYGEELNKFCINFDLENIVLYLNNFKDLIDIIS